ncbi:MAG: protein translocase subunit SecD [Planctomycetota bacterium]
MEQINLRSRTTLILVVTGVLLWSFYQFGIRLGQDLKGGTTLRFSLDLDRAEATGRIPKGADRERVVVETLKVINDRINSTGLAEISVTPLGEDKFEISLPAGSEGQTERIVKVVSQLGALMFRIEVRPTERYATDEGVPPRLEQPPYPWQGTAESFDTWKEAEVERWMEAQATATEYVPSRPDEYFIVKRRPPELDAGEDPPADWGTRPEHFAVLEVLDIKKFPFDGRIIKDPVPSRTQGGQPVVNYTVKTEYQNDFGNWTERNIGMPMAIVLNEEFISAPVIRDRLESNVQITLGTRDWEEAQAEAEQLATVLQEGSLKIKPQLESRTKIGAKLAGESKQRGIIAVFLGFLLVLVFMVLFYRGSGMVANLALLLNVVLLLGTLAFFQAVLTLPGIAGIVLTLGMAVDANILINERVREERRAGRSMRRAVSEGYDRAFTTIVDANVTSLITAILLYAYGSGAVRGFAITLAIGLVASMFTAIYVTRTVVEWRMKRGSYNEINMWGTGEPPKISWVGLRRFFAPISVVGVLFGLIVFSVEDRYTLYDVDFTGGFKIQARFTTAADADEVRRALRGDPVDVTVTREGRDENDQPIVEERVVRAGPYRDAEVVSVGTGGDAVEITVQRGIVPETADAEEMDLSLDEQSQAFEGYLRAVLADRLQTDWMMESPTPYAHPEDGDEELKDLDGGRVFAVTFYDPTGALNEDRIADALKTEMPFLRETGAGMGRYPASTVERTVVVRPIDADHPTLKTYRVWMKTTNRASGDVVETVPSMIRETLGEFLLSSAFRTYLEGEGVSADTASDVGLSEPFPSVDIVGESVAQRLKDDAMVALALSLLGIIIYVALRFHSRAMGFAAVLCLFHDVAITLGIVALANVFGIVDAKINLPMVAAFLTLVGYSVNDTVVVFDRIRENRGKKPTITPGMIDLSINQTLARSIKTSVTFLLACLALFILNVGQRNVLEGFAFLLIVGAVIGTYSTVAIASPLLLFLPWLWERVHWARPRAALVTYPASQVALVLLTPVAAALWLAWAVAFVIFAFFAGLALFVVWALTERLEGEATAVPAVA